MKGPCFKFEAVDWGETNSQQAKLSLASEQRILIKRRSKMEEQLCNKSFNDRNCHPTQGTQKGRGDGADLNMTVRENNCRGVFLNMDGGPVFDG